MSKPEWEKSPRWARWLALDGDGQWWWHSSKPSLEDDFEWFGSTRFKQAGLSDDHDFFRETLEQRP